MKTQFDSREVIITVKIAQIKELMLQIEHEFVEFVKEHEHCSVSKAEKLMVDAI